MRKTVGFRLSWQKKDADQTIKKSKRADLKLVEKSPTPAKTAKRLRELDTRECEQLKKTFFGYDIYYLYSDFQDWIERTGKEVPDNPPAAFTNWLKRCYNIAGPRMA
jgi:hypothetical protein